MNAITNRYYFNKIGETISFVFKIYNPFILTSALGLFLFAFFFPVRFIPDYCHLSKIENYRTFIWSLLGATLGFSGLILTVVLVTYNFYQRSTRRNTFEFIIENPGLKRIFSFFASNILLNVLGFCLINSTRASVTILYFLLFSTLGYILSLLPLAIGSLKYSTSMLRIQKLINKISDEDMTFLWSPYMYTEEIPFDTIEQNNIIILKDIGINAIKDGDWVLPQKILTAISDMVVKSADNPSKDDINKTSYCFLFVCKHFKRAALKNGESIIISVLFAHAVNLYALVANKKIIHFRHFDLDEYFKELCYNIIQSKDYPDVRDRMLKDVESILKIYLSQINYTDDQLPTFAYHFKQRESNEEVDRNSDDQVRYYWHYITHTQIHLLTDVIKFSIKQKDERVYEHFNWTVDSLIRAVYAMPNLTKFQRVDYFNETFYSLSDLSFYAIENGIYDGIEIVSHIQTESWIKEEERNFYDRALFYYSKLLKTFNKAKMVNVRCLDDFFMIGRSLSHQQIDVRLKEEILSYILDTGIHLFETRGDSERIKYYIQHQLSWLMTFLNEKSSLLELKNRYSEKINDIIKDYKYENFLDL